MKNPWFETVAEAQRRAKKRLPKSVYAALVAGSEKGLTVSDNIRRSVSSASPPTSPACRTERDLSTTVMGQPISFPVLISPTGVQAVHPDGEVAVARAAAARGTVMGLSCFASKPIEEVAAANPQTFFQTYWIGDKDEMSERLERVRAAGAVGLIATFDWSFSNGRDWGSPAIPDRIGLKAAVQFGPEVLLRPAWLREFARTHVGAGSHGSQPGPARRSHCPRSSRPTAGGWPRRRHRGTTWPGSGTSGTARSCSRG